MASSASSGYGESIPECFICDSNDKNESLSKLSSKGKLGLNLCYLKLPIVVYLLNFKICGMMKHQFLAQFLQKYNF